MDMEFDPGACTGCAACQVACLDQRDVRPMEGEIPLLRIEPVEQDGQLTFRRLGCTHCGACMAVCPTGCLRRDAYGLVQAEAELCVGCGACVSACPLGVVTLDIETNTVKKCDGCIGRRLEGFPPACCHTCPTGALSWKERSE